MLVLSPTRCYKQLRSSADLGPVTVTRNRDTGSGAEPTRPEGIALRPLKELVRSAFPVEHPLRAVILAEKDIVTPLEFLSKMEIWTTLVSLKV